MKIQGIVIEGLFGLYSYNIDFSSNENGLSLITAPNGYGKTTLLTIIDNLCPSKLYYFYKLTFDKIALLFDDQTNLSITQKKEEHISEQDTDLKISKNIEVRFDWYKDSQLLCHFVYNNLNIKKALKGIRYTFFKNDFISIFDDESVVSDEHLLDNEQFNREIAKVCKQEQFLMQLQTLKVEFIPANRIYQERPRKHEKGDEFRTPIEQVSYELKEKLVEAQAKYYQKSQSLDNLFIKNILKANAEQPEEGAYNKLYDELNRKVAELAGYGLVSKIDIPCYDSLKSSILYSYLKIVEEKISIFDTIIVKLRLLNQMMENKRFVNKTVQYLPQYGFRISSKNGDILDLNLLSSGEQNEIVLLYDLIFKVSEGSILLIDEPENSLHVVWQQVFVDDMTTIAINNKLQVIVATHSPSIVSRGSNCAIDLYYLQDAK